MTNWQVGDRVETRNAYGEALLELGRSRAAHQRAELFRFNLPVGGYGP